MHLIYIDESKDQNNFYVYSALCIDSVIWKEFFARIRGLRKTLKEKYGIYTAHELHAWKFVSGKGIIADKKIGKEERAEIFKQVLKAMAKAGYPHEQFCFFNSVNTSELFAFERLVNRINKTMQTWNSQALLFFDEGNEAAFTKRIRRMAAFNHIPSAFGGWSDKSTKNIPTNYIIEDPIYKDSKESYFIQLVDFVCYALLRKERPLASKTALGMDKAFELLEPILFKKANLKDPFGIIR